jgi:hypothetical protein
VIASEFDRSPAPYTDVICGVKFIPEHTCEVLIYAIVLETNRSRDSANGD